MGCPASRQATEAARPPVDRTAGVPVVPSRNAPVPYVHLASPAARQCSASSAACWSTASPATGSAGPNALVSPTISAQSTTAGSSAGSTAKAAHASADQLAASRSSSSVRDAVAASVTYPAPSRASSQVSVVVTTPAVVTFSRSQAIFGAAK